LRFVAVAVIAACVLGLMNESVFGQAKAKQKGRSQAGPDMANVSYGPHERNVMDVWKAKSDQPTPLLVFIHGGGFRRGSKEALQPYCSTAAWPTASRWSRSIIDCPRR